MSSPIYISRFLGTRHLPLMTAAQLTFWSLRLRTSAPILSVRSAISDVALAVVPSSHLILATLGGKHFPAACNIVMLAL